MKRHIYSLIALTSVILLPFMVSAQLSSESYQVEVQFIGGEDAGGGYSASESYQIGGHSEEEEAEEEDSGEDEIGFRQGSRASSTSSLESSATSTSSTSTPPQYSNGREGGFTSSREPEELNEDVPPDSEQDTRGEKESNSFPSRVQEYFEDTSRAKAFDGIKKSFDAQPWVWIGALSILAILLCLLLSSVWRRFRS